MESTSKPDKARVLIVGCGGIGTMAALNLERGHRAAVTAVLRSSYTAVENAGFTINSVDHGQVRGFRPSQILSSVPDVSQLDIAPYDYIVCATKNIPDVGPSIASLLRPAVTLGHSVIVLIQNGLNIELPLLEAFPDNHILSGVSMCGSYQPEPGVIEHQLHDDLGVGPFRDAEAAADKARDFVERYSAGGRCTSWYDSNVAFSRWRKLLLNAAINPTCAITGLDSGNMRLCPDLVEEVVRPAMEEIRATAAAYGHELTDEMMQTMIDSDPIESHIPPSMLVDVRNGDYIEHENLLGEPLRAAKAKQIPTPVLNNLYFLSRSYQWQLKNKHAA